METIQWLENYLQEQTAALVVISHDHCGPRLQPDRVDRAWDLRSYLGNYAHLEQKQQEQEATQAA